MKQATLLIVCITVASFSFANAGVNDSSKKICIDSSSIKATSMQSMLDQITNVIGINERFELKEANVLNLETKISHRKKIILYNPAFIETLNNTAKDNWSVMALLAHEIGHHLNGHTAHKGGSKPQLELEADGFAGYVLYKLGATIQQSQH